MVKLNVGFVGFIGFMAIGHAVAQPITGTVQVFQNDTGNNPDSVSLSLGAGSSPGVRIRYELSNRGDYTLDFPGIHASQEGVLISSVAQNRRNNYDGGSTDELLAATSSVFLSGQEDRYYIATAAAPSGDEFNINAAFGWFPYSQWLGGISTNGDGGRFAVYSASAGVGMRDANDGTSYVDLPGEAGPLNGILLVNSAENEDNFASSFAWTEANEFLITNHDNGVNGAVYEQDSVAFVYIPVADVGTKGLVAMGRINADGSRDLTGGSYTITVGVPGQWFLKIPGHSPKTGTLLVSPEGGNGNSVDNIISYEWSDFGDRWVIQSRDIPGMGLQGNTADPEEDFFSFAFFASHDPDAVTPKRIYVDAGAAGANNGASWDDAFTELTWALDEALAGDEIWVARGTYTPLPGYGRSDSFRIHRPVSLYGGFEPGMTNLLQRRVDDEANRTILSGDVGTQGFYNDNAYHVMTASDFQGFWVLDGFDIRDGFRNPNTRTVVQAGPEGGAGLALDNLQGALRVQYCTFRNHRVVGLGGVLESGNLPGDGASARGGALWMNGPLTVTLRDSAFYDNRVDGGPGRSSTVAYTSVNPVERPGGPDAGNGGEAQGGAVWMVGSIQRCLFENNRAFGGAGGRGINGRDGDSSFRDGLGGSDGGRGGNAEGGAVWLARGNVSESRFHGNHVLAGRGGNGGHGGDGDDGEDGLDGTGNDPGFDGFDGFDGWHGGDGGQGGVSLGGAIYSSVRAPDSQKIEDCEFVGNTVAAADGGDGGDGGAQGTGGDGGDGANTITTGAAGGDGGDNGDGGDGGDGGDMGNALGGAIYFVDARNKTIVGCTLVQNQLLNVGEVGRPGAAGVRNGLGLGGEGGEGFLGLDGNKGPNGNPGFPGSDGASGDFGEPGLLEGAAIYSVDYDANSRTETYNSIYWENEKSPFGFSVFGGGVPALEVGVNIASDAVRQDLTWFLDEAPRFIRSPNPREGGWDQNSQDNDYGDLRLFHGSPGIDLGDNGQVLDGASGTDVLGAPRILDGQVNLGAHERVMTSYGVLYSGFPYATDNNQDGRSNFENYLTATGPLAPPDPASQPMIHSQDGQVTITYQRRSNAAEGYLLPWLSYDLETWFEPIDGYHATIARTSISSGVEIVELTIPSGTPRLFFRRVYVEQ